MFKRRCRWQEVPEVPAVYRALLKVSKVGGIIGGGRWRGGSWGQSQGCYLGNNCKIASSPLLVMVGFFSLCCFLFFAQPCEAHLAIQRLGPIRAQGNGLFLLYFVFVYLKPPPSQKTLLFHLLFKLCSCTASLSITEVQCMTCSQDSRAEMESPFILSHGLFGTDETVPAAL